MTTDSDAIARRVVREVVADLPSTTDCAFNVAKKGQHRFCSRVGRKPIGGYHFCKRHADIVAQRILDALSAAL